MRKKAIPDYDKPYTKREKIRVINAFKKLAKLNDSPELRGYQQKLLRELSGK